MSGVEDNLSMSKWDAIIVFLVRAATKIFQENRWNSTGCQGRCLKAMSSKLYI